MNLLLLLEACGGAHWLARRCESYGHQVKLIPAQYVKPYVKTNKNDFIDADASTEASCAQICVLSLQKSELAQHVQLSEKSEQGYLKERTACMNEDWFNSSRVWDKFLREGTTT